MQQREFFLDEDFYNGYHYEITTYLDPDSGEERLEYCIHLIERRDGGWNEGYTWEDYHNGLILRDIKDVIDRA